MLHPVLGHASARAALARARKAGTLPPALLIRGMRGVGKQRLALWLGQLVLCERPGDDGPCGQCRPCRMALRLEHPDLHWVFPLPRPRRVTPDKLADALEEARAARLAEVRASPLQPSVGDADPTGIYLAAARTLRRRAHRRPSMASEQVFVIADAELLVPQESSPEAANALLKLLEEPPPDTFLILTSSEPGALLDTIRSRTVPLHLAPLPVEDVAAFLVSHTGADVTEARRAAHMAEGSLGRALGFLSTDDGPGPLQEIHERGLAIVAAALAPERGRGAALALEFRAARARGLLDLLAAVEEWLRDLAAVAAGVPDRARGSTEAAALARLLEQCTVHPEAVTRALPLVDQAALWARGNVNPQLIVAGLVAGLRARLRAGNGAGP